MRRIVVTVVLAVLAVATAHQIAVALGWIPLGREPGEDAAGESAALIGALTAMLAGAVALGVPGRTRSLMPLVPLAAVAFVVARFYTFDSYYAPSLRRMSDGGLVAPALVYVLVVAAVVTAALIVRWPTAAPIGAAVVLLALLTAIIEGAGH